MPSPALSAAASGHAFQQGQQDHEQAHEDEDPDAEADGVAQDRADQFVTRGGAHQAHAHDERDGVPESHEGEERGEHGGEGKEIGKGEWRMGILMREVS